VAPVDRHQVVASRALDALERAGRRDLAVAELDFAALSRDEEAGEVVAAELDEAADEPRAEVHLDRAEERRRRARIPGELGVHAVVAHQQVGRVDERALVGRHQPRGLVQREAHVVQHGLRAAGHEDPAAPRRRVRFGRGGADHGVADLERPAARVHAVAERARDEDVHEVRRGAGVVGEDGTARGGADREVLEPELERPGVGDGSLEVGAGAPAHDPQVAREPDVAGLVPSGHAKLDAAELVRPRPRRAPRRSSRRRSSRRPGERGRSRGASRRLRPRARP
jgi:hypothetical protein